MRHHRLSKRVVALLTASAVLPMVLALAGCNVIVRETGGASTEGVVEGVEAAVPGSEVALSSKVNGFATDLIVHAEVADASLVTAADVAAAALAICAAGPVGYDFFDLSFASGEPGESDRRFAPAGDLIAETYPELGWTGGEDSAYLGLESFCEAAS